MASMVGAAEAKSPKPQPTPVPQMSAPVIGTGGVAGNSGYELASSFGQWEVNIVKLSSSNGYRLEGGLWANLPEDACSSGASAGLPKPNCP
jgi:hypothetical protein